ncbi:hypothetical protein N566_27255 [Streptomycetaceae bacterium MP113-05]|nr:hypothetical protein N566_27255 [Streptomycetaceae bacterium MP113-05]
MSSQRTSGTIAATIRDRITSAVYAPGDSLPTGSDLAAEFGVSPRIIRTALTVLDAEGFVTRGRGAPATVNPRPSTPGSPAPQAAGVMLPDRLRVAFEAEHVTIDSFSLTAETLLDALAYAYQGVRARELAPQSISLRVLVPAADAVLALPRLIDDPNDPRPLDRLHGIMHTCHGMLAMGLDSLKDSHLVSDVSLELRSVPLTPMHKLYLLNGTESLVGYYEVSQRSVPIGGAEEEIWDVLGIEASLFRSSSGPDARDEQEATFVRASARWFESLWSSIARPVTLG